MHTSNSIHYITLESALSGGAILGRQEEHNDSGSNGNDNHDNSNTNDSNSNGNTNSSNNTSNKNRTPA